MTQVGLSVEHEARTLLRLEFGANSGASIGASGDTGEGPIGPKRFGLGDESRKSRIYAPLVLAARLEGHSIGHDGVGEDGRREAEKQRHSD